MLASGLHPSESATADVVADRFYPLNAEQDFGEAHTEIRYSSNVTMFGAKSENNYVRPRPSRHTLPAILCRRAAWLIGFL